MKRANLFEDTTVTTTNATTVEQVDAQATGLEAILSEFPKITLKQLADALGLSYSMVLSKSKMAVEGQVYSSENINYAEIEAYFIKKNVMAAFKTLPFAEMNESTKSSLVAKTDVELEVGGVYYSKYHKQNLTIVYMTEEYVALTNEQDQKISCLNKRTFINCKISKVESK